MMGFAKSSLVWLGGKVAVFSLLLAVAAGVAAALPATASALEVGTIAGADKCETAALQAAEAFPEGSSMAIIASDNAWADALSAVGLAGALDCPILLTSTDALSEATKDALAKLGTTRVLIVGSEAVVSANVADELLASGVATVDRAAGADRFATQMSIFEYGASGYDGSNHWSGDLVIVATGMNYPDTLSAGPLAFSQKAPIFIVNSAGELSVEQDMAIFGLQPKTALVLGSEAVVSKKTFGYLKGITAGFAEDSEPNAIRLGGSDRYGTSAAIAKWSTEKGYLTWDGAVFTTGLSPYDALTGSVVPGKSGSVMLLVDNATAATIGAAASHAADIDTMLYFGSEEVLPEKLRTYVKLSLQEGAALPMGGYLTKSGDYVWSDYTGASIRTAGNYAMWFNRAAQYTSETNWMIIVDTVLNELIVFKKSNGAWAVEKHWLCSTGAWNTPTVKGEYTIGLRGLSFGSGFTCWYWTQFYGDYLFHSVTYNPGSMTSIQEGQLGINISHGCVRLDINNAKWIYDNIPYRSKVVIY